MSNSSFAAGLKPKTDFKMFESKTYDGGYDLLFSDGTYRLIEVDEGSSTYRVYLGKTREVTVRVSAKRVNLHFFMDNMRTMTTRTRSLQV